MPAARRAARGTRYGRLPSGTGRGRAALVAFLLAGACGYVALEPWHGPIVLALSEQHGVDAADLPALPLIALGLVVARSRAGKGRTQPRSSSGSRVAAACALVLGAVLLAGILDPRIGSPLVPAGGGTFGGNTDHVDGLRAEPVGRWTHLAVTYDGATYRLYVDGGAVSSRPASGGILRTTDPLWIGGNRPYGEYFRGVIDEVRVYRRALPHSAVREAMSTPVAARGGPDAAQLAAAYALDAGAGPTAIDLSGNGNMGTIRGARWTGAGRFGAGLRFDGAGQTVRVPASSSLNLGTAMTLMAWIKPSESQSGWRTVVARQTDAYFLAAGGGRQNAGLLERLDRLRFALVIALIVAIGLAYVRGHAPWTVAARRWYAPVAVFVAGSLLDVAFASSDTLIGPALLALWCGARATQRDERVAMDTLAGVFAAVTILSIVAPASLPLPRDAGGIVRAGALGLMLACAALLTLRRGARARLARQ